MTRFAYLAPIAVEGACDHFFGRPLDENPYARDKETSDHWRSWREGWLDAAYLRDVREKRETARWRT